MISELFKNKVMILGSGDYSIRFRPHLNVKQNDIDLAIGKIKIVAQSLLN